MSQSTKSLARPSNSKFICVQSSYEPDRNYSFNDLATTHAGRSRESMYNRLKSMIYEQH